MTTKEKIIKKSIDAVDAEINSINHILFGRHLSQAFELEIESIEDAKKMNSKEAVVYLQEQIKKKNELMDLAKQSLNFVELSDKLVELEMELSDLKNELFILKRKKNN